MNNGISLSEACRLRVLAQEDFAKECNEDGTIKNQSHSTTFTVKDNGALSFTVNNTVMRLTLAGVIIAVIVVGVLLFRRLRDKFQF